MINLIPVTSCKIIEPSDNLCSVIINSLKDEKLCERDVLVVSSKVVALTEKRQKNLEGVFAGYEARNLSQKYFVDERLAQLIVENSDKILGGVKNVLLTVVYNNLIANAGIDKSNSKGYNNVILWPKEPYVSAENIRQELSKHYSLRQFGVIISDSHITPLRQGVIGSAIGVAGFEPVDDCIGRTDLFGRKMEYTKRAIADQAASAAHLCMGECDEQTPFVVIRGLTAKFTNQKISASDSYMNFDECLFMNSIRDYFSDKK